MDPFTKLVQHIQFKINCITADVKVSAMEEGSNNELH